MKRAEVLKLFFKLYVSGGYELLHINFYATIITRAQHKISAKFQKCHRVLICCGYPEIEA